MVIIKPLLVSQLDNYYQKNLSIRGMVVDKGVMIIIRARCLVLVFLEKK